MTPSELLRAARGVLDGKTSLRGSIATRGAALLARQALEGTLADALHAKGARVRSVPFSVQWMALDVVVERELAHEAALAWACLSAATHHHAYEMPPTTGEVCAWIEVAERLAVEVRRKTEGFDGR